MGGDGVRLRDVIQATHGFSTHEHPVFSPDGTRLAYYAGGFGSFQIHVVRSDGWYARPVTCGRGNHTQPAWSPDGRWLWYRAQPSSDAPWALWRSRVDDPNVRKCVLADPRVSFKHPSPSPDGRWLAWFSDRGSPGNFHLWKAPIDLLPGDGLRLGPHLRLTSDPERNDCHPVWSPDGRLLAFHAYMGRVEAKESHVFLCDADGGNPRRLTDVPALHKHPFFVGRDLVVHHTDEGEHRFLALRRVADGALVGRLPRGRKNDKHPNPFVPPRGPVRIAFASKKRGERAPAEADDTYDVFWGILDGVRVRR